MLKRSKQPYTKSVHTFFNKFNYLKNDTFDKFSDTDKPGHKLQCRNVATTNHIRNIYSINLGLSKLFNQYITATEKSHELFSFQHTASSHV